MEEDMGMVMMVMTFVRDTICTCMSTHERCSCTAEHVCQLLRVGLRLRCYSMLQVYTMLHVHSLWVSSFHEVHDQVYEALHIDMNRPEQICMNVTQRDIGKKKE